MSNSCCRAATCLDGEKSYESEAALLSAAEEVLESTWKEFMSATLPRRNRLQTSADAGADPRSPVEVAVLAPLDERRFSVGPFLQKAMEFRGRVLGPTFP
jgi:hypothetical protein